MYPVFHVAKTCVLGHGKKKEEVKVVKQISELTLERNSL